MASPLDYLKKVSSYIPVVAAVKGFSQTLTGKRAAAKSSFQKGLVGIGVTTAALGGLGTVAGRGALLAVGKYLVPTTTKKLLGTAAATVFGVGVLSSSKKARQAAKTVISPKTYFQSGKKVGKLIEGSPEGSGISGILGKTAAFGAGAGLVAAGVPITPQTTTVEAGGRKISPRRRSKRREAVIQRNYQKVNVVVSNRHTHNKYLKEKCLAY